MRRSCVTLIGLLAMAWSSAGTSAQSVRASPSPTRHKPGPVSMRGIAHGVHGSGFTLETHTHGSYSVAVTGPTSITEKGRRGRVTIHNGDHVGVRGFVQGRRLRAISVRIYPTKPKPYSVRGVIAAVDGAWLTLTAAGRSIRALTTGQTVIRIGRNAGSLAQLRIGDRVEVRIQPSSRGPIVLHMHVFRIRPPTRKLEIRGTISAVGSGTIAVTSGNRQYRVRVTSHTVVYVGTSRGRVGNLRAGQTVRVFACCAGRPLTATSIHIRKTPVSRHVVALRGRVTSISGAQIQLLVGQSTVTISIQRSTIFEVGSSHVSRTGIHVGDRVSVRAYRSGGALMATRVHAYVADRKPRTVIGVVLSTSRSGLVVQSRGRRYTVVAASGASVSLNGKPTSLGAIHEGDHVHAAGRLNGSTLSATRIVARRLPPKHVIVRGAITQINGSNLVIVDSSGSRRRVHLAPGAHVILAGKAAPGLALFPGVHASARGAMSGGTLVATTLTLTVRSRTVTGRLTRVTPNRIGVGLTSGRSVRIDLPHGATMSDGGKRITVGAMRIGAYVRVHGYVESSSSVRAMAVHVLHPTLDFSAVVVANSGAMVVRTSGGERYQLRLSSASQLTTGRENVDLTPAEVPVGVRVHARGRMGSDGALAISVLSVRLTSQTLRGTVSALGPQSLTLQATTGPVNVHLTGRTAIAQGSHTLVASDIVVGDDITVYGYNGGTGIELARKVLVHRKLIGIDGTVASLTADGFTLNSADGPHRVIVSSATIITGTTTTIATGLPVHVTGYRRGDGVILATRLRFKKK